ncbi:MAG: hypothetical protein DME22_09000 [Verrucomicrobia bacterium]|nr:MAG: hypothetical protein DME22_09000 [Verrucomicrobiota bacterium]
MKKIIITLLSAGLLPTPAVLGQPAQQRHVPTQAIIGNPLPQDQNLVQFDLNFPGGTPRQLVEAIEKASGKPLNAVIPDEDADLHLPPLKMRAVNVAELFAALSQASSKQINVSGGTYNSSYSFQTASEINDNSVWWFQHFKPAITQPECRFYQLAPYLETYKVEDITTAIQTGWKMLGEKNPPTISFHKDTKLLIAVGEESKLRMIDSVLQQLAQGKPQPQRESSGTKSAEPAKK